MALSKEKFSLLMENVASPDELDALTTKLAISAKEVNFHLASSMNFTKIGIGKCVYIPIQINNTFKGRESLYKLTPGSKTLAGLLVNGEDIFYRFVTRESGKTGFAKTGDIYTEEIRSTDGAIIAIGSGKINIQDDKKGVGEVVVKFKVTKGGELNCTFTWWAWSFYAELKLS
jgi:hypothetical protein